MGSNEENPLSYQKPGSSRKKIILGILVLISISTFCCCSFIAYGMYFSATQENITIDTEQAQIQQSDLETPTIATETAQTISTNTPEPTNTPISTNTPTGMCQ